MLKSGSSATMSETRPVGRARDKATLGNTWATQVRKSKNHVNHKSENLKMHRGERVVKGGQLT